MKFIKEIISSRQDEAGPVEGGFEREGPARGEALDLEAYSVASEAASNPVGQAPANTPVDAEETCRMVADATWMPPAGPADDADAEAGGASGMDPGMDVAEAGDDASLPPQEAPASENDEALGRDLGALAAQRAIAALASTREARSADGAMNEPGGRCRPLPQPGGEGGSGQASPRWPEGDPVAMLRPHSRPREAAIGELPDPFDRLAQQGGGGAAPAAGEGGRPSPRQRPEPAGGAPAAPAHEGPPRAGRPRTRLADDLSARFERDGMEIPAPAAGRAARRSGRVVKTRLLGFGGGIAEPDPLAAAAAADAQTGCSRFPVGWIVVVAGPGRGNAFTLFNGVSQIGRGEDQAVRLDFGDTSISRSNHAALAYDPRQRKFYLGHGGKANLVRLNGRPVLSTEELPDGSVITIGETTLRFVALCGAEFDWDGTRDDDGDRAVLG